MITTREGKTDCLKHLIRMFLLIWATLLFSARDSNAGAPVERRTDCLNGFCITLNKGEITAEAGLCVVIPCSFIPDYRFTPRHIVWYKCDAWKCSDSDMIFHTNKNNPKIQSGFRGRVSLLEPDVNQWNCSIIINDLTESDSGSYQLRVNGFLNTYQPDGFTFTPKATVSVKDLTQKPTLMIPPLTEGKQTTLSCTAPGLCSGSVPQITWTWKRAGENDSHITGNVTAESVTAVAQRYSSTLTFDPSAEHHGTNVTCKVSFTNNISAEETVALNVTYVKEVNITGNPSVKEGETLNLTCSVESFPPSLVAWTKFSDKNMQNGTKDNLQNDTFTDLQDDPQEGKTGMVTYSISNVTAEDSGQYICTATYLNKTLMEKVDVTVIYVKDNKEKGNISAEETATPENETVNLTRNTSVKENDTSVEPVPWNVKSLLEELLKTVQQPEVIIAFFIGILLSAIICGLATKCRRHTVKKRRRAENTDETLEMITTQDMVPLTDGTHDQHAAEEEAEATGRSVTNVDVEPKEVEYSAVDFSRLKRSPAGAEDRQGTTETEYAEIRTKDIKNRQDNDRADGEIVEANGGEEEEAGRVEVLKEKERVEELKEEEKEEEGMIGQDKETKTVHVC